jgi:hypothetical protein
MTEVQGGRMPSVCEGDLACVLAVFSRANATGAGCSNDGQVLEKLGGRTRARTWDPMIKSHLLYQLSYAPGNGPEKPSQEGVV